MAATAPAVYLLNDTSAVHAGSRAVMAALGRMLAHTRVVGRHRVNTDAIDGTGWSGADWIVVNGEGTIHHNQPTGRFLLDQLDRAQREGKRTALLNALFQQEPPCAAGVLARLDHFSVREIASAASARACGGDPGVRLDLCAAHYRQLPPLPPSRRLPPVNVGYQHDGAGLGFRLTDLGHPYYGLDDDFAVIIANLRATRLYITGQHHGVYAAGLAGIPFVAVRSNSHKIEGLIAWSGLPIPVCSTRTEIAVAIRFATRNRSVFSEFHRFLLEQPVPTGPLPWNG
jgi:hypothetical protein